MQVRTACQARDGRALCCGETARAIARALRARRATVTTARDRWQAASELSVRAARGVRRAGRFRARVRGRSSARPSGRSSRPARRRTGGRCGCAALTGRHRSTCWKVLQPSRRLAPASRAATPEPAATSGPRPARCCTSTPTAPKFAAPGHWAHGDRAERHRTRGAGKTVVIGVIDDHTRLVYCELHSAENADNVSATLRRARRSGCASRAAAPSRR